NRAPQSWACRRSPAALGPVDLILAKRPRPHVLKVVKSGLLEHPCELFQSERCTLAGDPVLGYDWTGQSHHRDERRKRGRIAQSYEVENPHSAPDSCSRSGDRREGRAHELLARELMQRPVTAHDVRLLSEFAVELGDVPAAQLHVVDPVPREPP